MDLSYTIKTSAELAGAQAMADSLERQIGQAKALKQDYSELSVKLDTVRESIKGADVASEHAEINHRALNRTLGEMNRVIPGLGTALEFLAHGYQASTVAAEEATAANDEMMVSMGALAVVFLSIQAATEYWDMYKESAAGALEAQTKASTELDTVTRKMLETRDAFNEAMEKGVSPAEHINQQLDLQTKIIQAQIKAQLDLLKAKEDAELAGASSPAQKDEIKSRYQSARDLTEDQGDASKTNLVDQAKLQAARQQEQLQMQLDAMLAEQLKLTHGEHHWKVDKNSRGQVMSREDVITGQDAGKAGELQKEIQKLRDQIVELNNAQEKYGNRVSETQTVGGINQSGRSAVENTGSSSKALRDAEDIADRGPQNDQEAQFAMRMAQLASGHALNLQQAEAYLQSLEKNPQMLSQLFDRLLGYNQQVLDQIARFDQQLAQMRAAVDHR